MIGINFLHIYYFFIDWFRKLTDSTDYLIRRSRAFSENRLSDPYYCNPKSLSFMPMALRVARSPSPYRYVLILKHRDGLGLELLLCCLSWVTDFWILFFKKTKSRIYFYILKALIKQFSSSFTFQGRITLHK